MKTTLDLILENRSDDEYMAQWVERSAVIAERNWKALPEGERTWENKERVLCAAQREVTQQMDAERKLENA